MFVVQGKLIHLDIIQEHFVCDLNSCKGACCVEGDFGAPLDEQEKKEILKVIPILQEHLEEEAVHKLEKDGYWTYYKSLNSDGTPLLENGQCAYLVRDQNGIAKCGFELLFSQGKSAFRKPISCHLYPIRINQNSETGFESLNYDRWEICQSACSKGISVGLKLYEFCKEAIMSKYGEDFYRELAEIATAYHLSKDQGPG